MNLFQRNHLNKQIKSKIIEADTLCQLLEKCIVPANNIYWCNDLQLNATDDDQENLHRLKYAAPAFASNAKQLRNLYLVTEQLCEKNPEMRAYVISEFCQRLQTFDNQISNLIDNIKNLTFYDQVAILQQTVAQLKIYLQSIKENKKFILSRQQNDCNILDL